MKQITKVRKSVCAMANQLRKAGYSLKDAFKKAWQRVKLSMTVRAAGVSFENRQERLAFLQQFKPEDLTVTLEREKENKFDSNAIQIVVHDTIDEQTRSLYRQGISAFGGISPTYRIALEKDSPVIVWDFHSLLVMVQMCFSFMLTDKDSDMRMCKHCKKAFVASRKGNEFCSQRCKNQFNVYKSREKKKGNQRDD